MVVEKKKTSTRHVQTSKHVTLPPPTTYGHSLVLGAFGGSAPKALRRSAANAGVRRSPVHRRITWSVAAGGRWPLLYGLEMFGSLEHTKSANEEHTRKTHTHTPKRHKDMI